MRVANGNFWLPPAIGVPERLPDRDSVRRYTDKEHRMLVWVLAFLVVALIAAFLGFGGIAGASVEIGKIIFFLAVALFLISAIVSIFRGRTRA